jgi:uncharacterized protein (TIGR02453 family)
MSFRGWPQDALDFYVGLEADNSKTYFHAHKATYDECVKAPFLALSEEIADEFGALRVFRPNRDIRFAKDKTPYKTAAAAVTEGEGGTAFYVQVSSTGLFVGSGYHHLATDQLERFRAAVDDAKAGPKLAAAITGAQKAKFQMGTSGSLQRAPRGYPHDHPRIDLLRLKGMHIGKDFGAPRWLHTHGAFDRIVKTWRDAAPVNTWFDRHVGPSTLAPPEPD